VPGRGAMAPTRILVSCEQVHRPVLVETAPAKVIAAPAEGVWKRVIFRRESDRARS
jgi:hypothetical protein